MTEEEMKTKWCPHLISKCKGSECAVWQWSEVVDEDEYAASMEHYRKRQDDYEKQQPSPTMLRFGYPDTRLPPMPPNIPTKISDTHGYCGLAGKP
jgi:hypothetical protein